jgi:hypothetical protein
MHLNSRRSLSLSASSASTFKPIQTTCHFYASAKAEAPNDDCDDFDDRIAIYGIDDSAHSLACRQMTGEKQEMDVQGRAVWITGIKWTQEEMFRHRWIPGTGGQTLI